MVAAGTATIANGEVAAGYLTINGTQIGTFTQASNGSATQLNLITAINNKTTTTGITAVAVTASGSVISGTDMDSTARIVLSNTTGAAISASLNSSVSGGGDFASHVMSSASMSVSAGQNGKIIFNDSLTDTSVSMST